MKTTYIFFLLILYSKASKISAFICWRQLGVHQVAKTAFHLWGYDSDLHLATQQANKVKEPLPLSQSYTGVSLKLINGKKTNYSLKLSYLWISIMHAVHSLQ